MIENIPFHHRCKVTYPGNISHSSNHFGKCRNEPKACDNCAGHKRDLEREKNNKRDFQYSQCPSTHLHIGALTLNAPFASTNSNKMNMSYDWNVGMYST